MSSESDFGNECLDAIIADCYEAQEQGRSIDRPALLTKYPNLQPQLLEFFADLDKMAGLLGAEVQGSIQAKTVWQRALSVRRWAIAFAALLIVGILSAIFVRLTMYGNGMSYEMSAAFVLLFAVTGLPVMLAFLLAAPPVWYLRSKLKDTSPFERLQAIGELRSLGPAAQRAVPDLIERMNNDPSKQVQIAATEALPIVGINDNSAAQALRKSIETSDDLGRARKAVKGEQLIRDNLRANQDYRVNWQDLGRWVRSLFGHKTEITQRQTRALLFNGIKAAVGCSLASVAVLVYIHLQSPGVANSDLPSMARLYLITSVILSFAYPFIAVFSREGNYFVNPRVTMFGLSSRTTSLVFGILVLGLSGFGGLRGMTLCYMGVLGIWESIFPPIRPTRIIDSKK